MLRVPVVGPPWSKECLQKALEEKREADERAKSAEAEAAQIEARNSKPGESLRRLRKALGLAQVAFRVSVSHESAPESLFQRGGGVCADYISRAHSAELRSRVLREKRTSTEKVIFPTPSSFKIVACEVNRENLYCQLMYHITAFWKSQNHPDWQPKDLRTFIHRCREIQMHKFNAERLRAKVAFECAKRQMQKQKGEKREDKAARLSRLEDFWEDFQADKVKDEPAAPPPAPRSPWCTVKPSTKFVRASSSRGRDRSRRRPPVATKDSTVWERGPFFAERQGFRNENAPKSARSSRQARDTWPPLAGQLEESDHGALDSSRGGTAQTGRSTVTEGCLGMHPRYRLFTPNDGRLGSAGSCTSRPSRPRTQDSAFPRHSYAEFIHTSTSFGTYAEYLESRVESAQGRLPVFDPGIAARPLVGRGKYIGICQRTGTIPMTIPFVTGHSLKFKAAGKALVDPDLVPVIAMAKELERLEEVDLSGNALLTSKALVPLLQVITTFPQPQLLAKLNLNGCKNAGKSTIKAIADMLSGEQAILRGLRALDLSGINIPIEHAARMTEGIGQHSNLRELSLGGTGLGDGPQAPVLIKEIFNSVSLDSIDLGWNLFDEAAFVTMGEAVVDGAVPMLRSLSVPNCTGTALKGYALPIEHFIEILSRGSNLTRLDLSINHIDYRGALLIEDAFEDNKTLKDLDVSHNSMGVAGLRSIIRLLARDESGLVRLSSEKCSSNDAFADDMDLHKVFSVTNPCGRYSLDLSRPYHRTLLRMLYKSCERFHFEPASAFANVTYSLSTTSAGHQPYRHPQKNAYGLWAVPTRGKLGLTFRINWIEVRSLNERDEWDFGGFLGNHYSKVRRKLQDKEVPLLSHWKVAGAHHQDQLAILDALAKDFLLTFSQTQALCSTAAMVSEVLCRTFHCIVGGQATRYLSTLLAPTVGDFMRNFFRLRNFMGFTVDNPTGHYRLDLAVHTDHAIAEQLLLLDRWEVEVERQLQRPDVSQYGDRSHLRNMRHHEQTLRYVGEWVMPNQDMFEFDYVSGKRPPADAVVLDSTTMTAIFRVLQENELDFKVHVDVLRLVLPYIYLTVVQVRELIGMFRSDKLRHEVLISSFFRVADMYNEKVFRVRLANRNEIRALQTRLGFVTYFPFIQPEQVRFEFDFTHHDQRLATCLLVSALNKSHNLHQVSFVDAEGHPHELPQGVPRSWETYDKIPRGGMFCTTYNCAPEDRNFASRKQLFERYGHWHLPVSEREIMWWSSTVDVPDDVNEFMEFLVGRFKDVRSAFNVIDGFNGNGEITKKELQDALRRLNCRKFAGPDEAKRVNAVFRFLDPSGEGKISVAEWMVLDELWKEMTLSLQEFVQFLSRALGSVHDFLGYSWNLLDEDNNGSVSRDEWKRLVEERLGYFGPSGPIFNFLDKDDEGTVSLAEFKALQKFAAKAAKSEKKYLSNS